jgi:hypothetical protein
VRRFDDDRSAQVHVPLRRRQVLMSGELLDGPCRRATHRQMRTERVAKTMAAADVQMHSGIFANEFVGLVLKSLSANLISLVT